MAYSLGIDIGGTFTDLVLYDPVSDTRHNLKILTTPDEPARAVIEGARKIVAQASVDPAEINRVVHATTLFTNAIIERKGAVTGLVTTEGFRDILEIARERKFELYNIFIEMPRPLVDRPLRKEVCERISPRGDVETPLDLEELGRVSDELVAQGVNSIAVAFLQSYANPKHENEAATFITRRHPGVFVTTSFEVAPEIREYERMSTAVANAYVKPLATAYLESLERQLRNLGVLSPLFLMVSSGGLTHVTEAKRTPIQLLESGPAAGALAAAFFGGRSNIDHVLAFDMGGTTAKLSVVDEGEPLVAYKFEAARTSRFKEGSGLPVKISTIELIEIGAGGGSIAQIDGMGLMKVGPESASSKPGPACYGLGGARPTVTDANLALGYLNPDFFAGGSMAVDRNLASNAIGSLSEVTGMTMRDLAWGVHDIVNENMASAARVHIAERGKDLRKYALVATGGGGPLHGYQVARKLGLGRVICPPGAGVASALGLLIAPARVDRVATIARHVANVNWADVEKTFVALEDDARKVISETVADADVSIRRLADMRYVGQGFELVVQLPDGPYDASVMDQVLASFRASYREVFTLNPPTDRIEIVNIRIIASAPVGSAGRETHDKAFSPDEAVKQMRPVYFPEVNDFLQTKVYDRAKLPSCSVIKGPAVIEEPESTLLVGPGGSFSCDSSGNIVVDVV